MPPSLKICSYNILNDFHAIKWRTAQGIKTDNNSISGNWEVRKDRLLENMNSIQADILCLQEVNTNSCSFFENALGIYTPSLYGFHGGLYNIIHEDITHFEDHHGQAQLYKKDGGLSLADSGVFAFNGEKHRIAVWSVYKYAGLRVGVLNVHLKGYDLSLLPISAEAQAGNDEMEAYTKLLQQQECDVCLVVGDFNADRRAYKQQSPRFLTLEQEGYSPLMFEGTTCNGHTIDWGFLKVQKSGIEGCAYIPDIRYPEASDHMPIVVELHFGSGIDLK